MKNELVSVVTATYNMGNFIEETLDSILAQEYENIESIVVDDGSTDNTSEVLAKYRDDPRVKVIRQANAGQTVAKNHGIKSAQGEFIAFCDADDTWRKDKLSKQIPLFKKDLDIAVVYSHVNRVNEKGDSLNFHELKRHNGWITAPLLLDNFIPFVTTVVRSRVLEEFEGFDESLTMSIDYDLWLRISTKYKFEYVPEQLANYRIWPGQMSKRTGERLENFFKLLDRFFEKYPGLVNERDKKKAWAHTHVTRGMWHAANGKKSAAVADYLSATKLDFFDLRLWRAWAALAIGRKIQ